MSKHRPSTTGTRPTRSRRVRVHRRPTVSRASSVAALLARVVR